MAPSNQDESKNGTLDNSQNAEKTAEKNDMLKDLDKLTHVKKGANQAGAVKSKFFDDVSKLSPHQRKLIMVIEDTRTEMVLGAVIMLNMVCLVVETDATVDDGDAPKWITVSNYILMVIYILELTMRLFAYHCKFFTDGWNVMDFVIVGTDVILTLIGAIVGSMPRISVLRAFRLVRICRAFKALSMFPELALLLQGFVNAIKAIIWGMTLILIVICVWSILAVQLIHPLNKEVTNKGLYRGSCDRCPHAFSTVFYSMLTIFQTLVAGDSWGTLALPIIEEYPYAGFFFLCVLVTVSLAIMNLILAVIVERAQDSKQESLAEVAEEKKQEFEKAAIELLDLCAQLDKDKSHCLSKQELLSGFQEKQFADAMEVMGLKEEDMGTLFDALDEDGSGDVQYVEFVDQLFKFRNPDIKTVIFELTRLQLKVGRIQQAEAQNSKKSEARTQELTELLSGIRHQLDADNVTLSNKIASL